MFSPKQQLQCIYMSDTICFYLVIRNMHRRTHSYCLTIHYKLNSSTPAYLLIQLGTRGPHSYIVPVVRVQLAEIEA